MIFYGCTREGDTGVTSQEREIFRAFRLRIFNILGFIEDDHLKIPIEERLGQERKYTISR